MMVKTFFHLLLNMVHHFLSTIYLSELHSQHPYFLPYLHLPKNNILISKWETGKGYPDITLLDPIANALSVSVAELISGNTVYNSNISANMLRSQFYVCPVCGNVIHGMGESVIHCHGVLLQPEEAEETDENHKIFIEHVEDEYYVQIRHEMTKDHYISFIAAVSSDRMQMVKLYPEGDAQARFKINGVKKIYFYCNRSGLFSVTLLKN